MPKSFMLLFIAFLLSLSLTQASTLEPWEPKKTSLEGVELEIPEKIEGCEAVGEEECMMRRILDAHTDYIYTHEKHN